MKDAYNDTAETIMRLRDHRDPFIRKTVVSLIPTLATYDTQTFSDYFLHKAMVYLLGQLRNPIDKSIGEFRCLLSMSYF